jgi:hypothetical protein
MEEGRKEGGTVCMKEGRTAVCMKERRKNRRKERRKEGRTI